MQRPSLKLRDRSNVYVQVTVLFLSTGQKTMTWAIFAVWNFGKVQKMCKKIRIGRSLYSCGEFMRLAITFGLVESCAEVAKSAVLFRSICNRDAMEAFISYCRLMSMTTTVHSKCNQILKVLTVAAVYFERRENKNVEGDMNVALRFVRSFQDGANHKCRQRAAVLCCKKIYELSGPFICPENFSRFVRVPKRKLEGIISAFGMNTENYSEFSKARAQADENVFGQNIALIGKWSLNLIALIAFDNAGQRLEVYSQLQVQSWSYLQIMEVDAATNSPFEHLLIDEKNSSNSGSPKPRISNWTFTVCKVPRHDCSKNYSSKMWSGRWQKCTSKS